MQYHKPRRLKMIRKILQSLKDHDLLEEYLEMVTSNVKFVMKFKKMYP